MTTFLFWNLFGNQNRGWALRRAALQSHLVRLATSWKVDVFMFAESAFDPVDLVSALNHGGVGTYAFSPNENSRIQVFTRFDPKAVVNQFDSIDGRLTIRRMGVGTNGILLAVMHFQSRFFWSREDQLLEATNVSNNIILTEDALGHRRTVLVGDFNMNPFDPGVVCAQALNAVMTRGLARAGERTVSQKRYPMFYNPMWGYFGDRTPGPPGTYFYRASAPTT